MYCSRLFRLFYAAVRPLSHEVVAVDIEDAIRMNADCMVVQPSSALRLSSIDNLSQVIERWLPLAFLPLAFALLVRTWAHVASSNLQPVSSLGWAAVKTYDCRGLREAAPYTPSSNCCRWRQEASAGARRLHLAYDVIRKQHAALTWAATSSRAPILCRCRGCPHDRTTRAQPTLRGMGALRGHNPPRARTARRAGPRDLHHESAAEHKCAAHTWLSCEKHRSLSW